MTGLPEVPYILRLLGTPRVEGPDGSVDLPLGKPLAALCYLALEPSGVRRSDLGRILWPSSTEPRAKASIRQALWLIRKQTHADIVREADGQLTLDPTLIQIDLTALGRHLAHGQLVEACALWDGGPLRGFSVPDAQPWLAWADLMRSRWENQMGQALEDQAANTTGEERTVWLRRALEVRPYRVEGWYALVQTLVDLRDVEGADEALDRLRQVADEDDADLVREAEDRLRLLRRAAYGDPSERLVPDFVGRSQEFSSLMDAWRSALSGRSRVVGIVGPAGIGKSSLAAEALRHAEIDAGTVVEVRSVRTETTLDLGVVGSVVAALLRRPGAAGTSPGSAQVLRSLVPSEGETAGSVPRPTTLADAVADLLDAVSDEAPVMLLVEDAHWIDEPSSVVLLRALRQLRGARVMMVWTCRPEGKGASRGIAALRDAVEQGSAHLIELDPLTEPEVEEMVALLLTDVDPTALGDLAQRIYDASGGSPLHIVELLQGMRDRGAMARDAEGQWVIAEDALASALEPPPSLTVTLAQRVEQLSDDARRVGAGLADAGVQTPEALRRVSALSETEFDEALGALLDRDLVRWTRDDRLQLAHERLGEAFRNQAPKPYEPPHRTRWKRWGLGAAALLVLAVGAAVLQPDRSPSVLYGGGTIWIAGSRVLTPIQFLGGSDPWRRLDSIRVPSGFSVQGAPRQLDSDGRTVVVLQGHSVENPDDPPRAALYHDGRFDTLYTGPGDGAVGDIGPDRHTALLNIQNPDTARYRSMIVRLRLDEPRVPVVIAEGENSYRNGRWTDDGRHVVMFVDAPWDTVLVTDPAGRRVASLPGPVAHIVQISPCGPDGVLVTTSPPGQLEQHHRWSWNDGRLAPVVPAELPQGAPSCSPDGMAMVYVSGGGEAPRLVIQELEGPVVARLPLEAAATFARWNAPPSSPPDGVELEPPGAPLSLGQRLTLRARVFDVEGREMEDRPVTWTSDSPAVVSVSERGLLVANRPGVATVRATVDGWIQDTARVVVTARSDGTRLALADSFVVLDTLAWYALGSPVPTPTRDQGGRPALYLNGDGRYTDGLRSRAAFDLSSGATLEATFRLDGFARPDRDRVRLCLTDGDPGELATNHANWVIRQEACLQWPALLGPTDVDTMAVTLSLAQVTLGAIPIDTLLQTGRWNRITLQMRADGRIWAAVNDSVIAAHPVPVRNDADVRWHISVVGHSVDTRLLLRDVTLWREERLPGGG